MTDLATNVLYYGDNLGILRRYLPDAAPDPVSITTTTPAVEWKPRPWSPWARATEAMR